MSRPFAVSQCVHRTGKVIEAPLDTAARGLAWLPRMCGCGEIHCDECLAEQRGEVRVLWVASEPLVQNVSGRRLKEILARSDNQRVVVGASNRSASVGP
jgi:hypothetical protein